MPALPPVSKVVRIDHHLSQTGGSNIQVRNFFQYSGSLSLTDATTWLANIDSAWRTFVAAVMSTTLDHVLSELTDLTSNTAPQIQNSTGGAGGVGGDSLTAGVAMVIKHHINRRYRGGHPRVYIPGMVNAYVLTNRQWQPSSLGTVTADYITYINAAVANTNPVAIGTITHVNVSYYSGFTNHTYPSGRVKAIPTPRVTPLVDLITAYVGNPIVASQRRRNEQP